MKKVYFVRHGITEGNEKNAWQHAFIPLSEKGRSQAVFLAERFAKISFDVLIASDMERAQETARAIGGRTGHEVISEPLFQEIIRPTVLRGRVQTDPDVEDVIKAVRENFANKDFRHSDEENFFDLKQRALQAVDYLVSRPEETIAVVTHGTILKMIISVMMTGEDTSPEFFLRIDKFLVPHNTGITWCEYDNQFHPKKWQLITWNDHAHLG